MPYVRTCPELADAVADLAGIYGCPPPCQALHTAQGHPEACWCRQCFTVWLTAAMRQAVSHERVVAQLYRAKEDTHG